MNNNSKILPIQTKQSLWTRLSLYIPSMTKQIIIILFFIILLSVATLLSASSYRSELLTDNALLFFVEHNAVLLFGICAGLICIFINVQSLRILSFIGVCMSIICLILVNFTPLGIEGGGSERWLNIGFMTVQPSEFAKLAVILLLADGLVCQKWYSPAMFIRLGLILLIIILLLLEPDLGSAILISCYTGFMLFIAGANIFILLLLLIVGLSLGGVMLLTHPYQMQRITSWLHPEQDPVGSSYNLLQSQYALSDGGFLGVGYGESFYKLGYLPVSYADFIFGIFGEEFGFIGVFILISLYIGLLCVGMNIALKTSNLYLKFMSATLIFALMLQIIFNLGGATGVLPITGVPLPFMSYGKSSLFVTCLMFGLLIKSSLKIRLK